MADDPFDLADFDGLPSEPPSNAESNRRIQLVMRREAQWRLRQLGTAFARDGSPLHAFQALAIAYAYGLAAPRWAMRFAFHRWGDLAAIGDEAAAGRPILKQAERVGKALGFGTTGAGRGGWFHRAALAKRDHEIFTAVVERLRTGDKRYVAYEAVAAAKGLHPSAIAKAWRRHVAQQRQR